MGLLSITEMICIVRKYFLRILALSLAVGLIGGYVTTMIQTYTCTLGFKYNHKEAAEGLAPDGESKLDPYEIQNPVVIQAALGNMGLNNGVGDVKGIRQNISINKVITELDKEVSESAALLGEKYDIAATEYEMKFTYNAALGDEFGARMFSSIITEYDKFLLSKYYNKKTINDFAKVINNSSADYMIIADTMNSSIEDIINYLDEMAGYYPDYRATTTGYTFSELSLLYQNLRDIEYAKYYGNIRAGNLSKDREMIIKSYQKKVKDLQQELDINYNISENYKSEISTFYNSYKASGLYLQAERVRSNVDSTNNRDQDVLEDSDLENYKNTYDDIILSYAEHAGNATDASRTINYYNRIINAYIEDTVPIETKTRLIEKNKTILAEISALSAQYSDIANRTIDELYASMVNTDLQYLILPEVTTDKPVKFIAAFLTVVAFGLAVIAVFIFEVLKKNINIDSIKLAYGENENEKVVINTEGMDELHQLLYEQYLKDFEEFYLVYQPMVSGENEEILHKEVFIRWRSHQLGMVSPGKIIDVISDFGIFKQLNDWIIKNVCEDLATIKENRGTLPVIHINCPYSQINDFALNDIIIEHIRKNNIPAKNICLELVGKDIAESLEDIMLLEEMGIKICIDRFENSDEEREIIDVVKPGYIKMSLDVLNSDMYATSDEDIIETTANMINYFSDIVEKCHKNGIKACICGIEKKSHDNIVSKMGFDFKQGYYYGKPERIAK